ncbi:callose synthase 5 isoform X3 [Arachis ipaensis]|uniref:callose synthase 5 isoform X3 n=1 Tax=Arachis ipaensis TaxID=130454 RepID=UPI000A2B7B38|nr:callose synthase 5 isoform X3 [Arachis ipaensis]XP_025650113.1 callose synthase 5 isoform X3 [Arachis hypogaea]
MRFKCYKIVRHYVFSGLSFGIFVKMNRVCRYHFGCLRKDTLPIMQLEENTQGLNWPSSFEQQRQRTGDLDLLDWLKAMFGFQRDNVRNQREHLILLLANSHIRLHPKPEPLNMLDDRAVDEVMKKLFKNYKKWCKFLGRKHSLRLPQGQQEVQQRKLLYMGLYLLIWGEASNVCFMPECLCYIFHNFLSVKWGVSGGYY